MHQTQKRIKFTWFFGAVVILLTASLLPTTVPVKEVGAAPSFVCDTNGYLFKYPGGPTDVHRVDMVTGKDELAKTITGREINAVGYNIKDDHYYEWDDQNDVFVKISSDFTTVTPIPTITNYTGPNSGVIIGDVDDNGHYWQVDGNTWHEIDLTKNPIEQVSSGTPGANPTGSAGADWAFVPDTDSLYRTMENATNVTVWAFSRTTKTWTNVGNVTNITGTDRTIGANYADPHMHLYASSNATGNLWRIDLSPFNATAAHVGTGNPSSSNDGARCALATVPTDAGDAPSGYDTLFEDGGPRHNVVGFNVFNSTAPLMLGKKVDIENNGFPGSEAAGDDADHEGVAGGGFVDDERGVAHIVATPNNSDPLVVPVYVTNTASDTATLAGWVDLDNDGAFETGERVSAAISAGFTGYQQLTFPAPPAPYTTNTFARFRLFSAIDTSSAATGLLPIGSAAVGEVEDVLVQVGTYNAIKTANPAEGTTVKSGQTVKYTLNVKNTGVTNLVNLKVDDDMTDVLDDATLEGTPTVSPSSAGTASVSGNTLEFAGDIGIGQTVTITYTVKVEFLGALGNGALGNTILAAHSNCHPDVSGGAATVDDPSCNTDHPVLGLAATGMSLWLVLGLAGGLIVLSGAVLIWFKKKRPVTEYEAPL